MISARSKLFWIAAVALALTILSVSANRLTLDSPGQREFVRDTAGLIHADDVLKIQTACDSLLTTKAVPIIVVTVESMALHGGEGLGIETFARKLFDQWGISQPTLNGTDWNRGILLLVSKQDRRARIELGKGWGRSHDDECARIMETEIIPQFRDGNFSRGIVAGVNALEVMTRSLQTPLGNGESQQGPLLSGFWRGVIAFAIVIGFICFGRWGWSITGWMLGSLISRMPYWNGSRNRGSSGTFGGGSFGGGSSGGGGATGKW